MYLESLSQILEFISFHLLGNGIHPLRGQLETYCEQFLREMGLLLLQFLPVRVVQHPCDTITIGGGCSCPFGVRKERQFPACRAGNNKFRVFALWILVSRFQGPALKQIETVWLFARPVEGSSSAISLAYKEGGYWRPKVFRLV